MSISQSGEPATYRANAFRYLACEQKATSSAPNTGGGSSRSIVWAAVSECSSCLTIRSRFIASPWQSKKQQGRQQELAVLCQHEYHASEPGWHCHVTFADADTLPLGVTRSHLRRWPQVDVPHSRLDFGVHERNAASIAAARFPHFLVRNSLMNADDICKAFCRSVALQAVPVGYALRTPFMGPDGDPLTIYLRRDESTADSASG